jgi:hypothetical protein
MEPYKQSKYDSFEGFVREIIEERRRQGKPVDNLLAAISTVLGLSTLITITRKLNITDGISLSVGLVASIPIIGAIAGASGGTLLAKYIAKSHSKDGIAATRILKKAESLYWDYSTASLDDTEKKELINDLFKDVLEDKEPT